MMKLYDYPRSSACFRVRIALHLKNIPFDLEPIDLLTNGQNAPDYLALNPQGVVPTLQDGEVLLSQSLAILEYLEERHPETPLLPGDAKFRARIRQLALIVGCETHPLQNLSVLRSLGERFDATEEAKRAWARAAIERGLKAFSEVVERSGHGPYCHGQAPTLADVFLVPQLFNARRFECELSLFPRLMEIDERCMNLEAFQRAAPGE